MISFLLTLITIWGVLNFICHLHYKDIVRIPTLLLKLFMLVVAFPFMILSLLKNSRNKGYTRRYKENMQ